MPTSHEFALVFNGEAPFCVGSEVTSQHVGREVATAIVRLLAAITTIRIVRWGGLDKKIFVT